MTATPLGFLKENPQVRLSYDEEELRLLGESLKKRQLQPILIRPDGTIIAGHRRYRAAKLVGLESLEAIIIEDDLSPSEIRGIQLTENIHRADLNGYEKWIAVHELMTINPTWQQKEVAEHLKLDAGQITRILSPSKCIPAIQEALKAGKLTTSHCYKASQMKPEDQEAYLALILSGASREEQEKKTRKRSEAPAVRASKIKCPLPSGAVVTVAGDGLSLDDMIETLNEAIKMAKKARDQGLDSKTAVRVWSDMAVAG